MGFKSYYYLAKPGIVYGNAITAAAGFLFASAGHISLSLFVAMLAGISLVMGSACAFNNYIDRDIDKKMARTKKRALVRGSISNRNALIYASALSLAGFSLLALTNLLTLIIAATGFVVYVVWYGFEKRRSPYGTLVGSISGAVPPVVGYCAVTNTFDTGALILFLILTCWQMPHFYAIALHRLNDYKAAGIPVLPLAKGIVRTKTTMLIYILAFMCAASLLAMFGYAGYTYLIIMIFMSVWWLRLCVQGFRPKVDQKTWAREQFMFSLVVLLTFSAMISIDFLLP